MLLAFMNEKSYDLFYTHRLMPFLLSKHKPKKINTAASWCKHILFFAITLLSVCLSVCLSFMVLYLHVIPDPKIHLKLH
jgi:hypothetical protein